MCGRSVGKKSGTLTIIIKMVNIMTTLPVGELMNQHQHVHEHHQASRCMSTSTIVFASPRTCACAGDCFTSIKTAEHQHWHQHKHQQNSTYISTSSIRAREHLHEQHFHKHETKKYGQDSEP